MKTLDELWNAEVVEQWLRTRSGLKLTKSKREEIVAEVFKTSADGLPHKVDTALRHQLKNYFDKQSAEPDEEPTS